MNYLVIKMNIANIPKKEILSLLILRLVRGQSEHYE